MNEVKIRSHDTTLGKALHVRPDQVTVTNQGLTLRAGADFVYVSLSDERRKFIAEQLKGKESDAGTKPEEV